MRKIRDLWLLEFIFILLVFPADTAFAKKQLRGSKSIVTYDLANKHLKGSKNIVTYDRGKEQETRVFTSAERCRERPCVVTGDGAIRISREMYKNYRFKLGILDEGFYRPISMFEESTKLEERLSERIFNRKQNRKVFNLTRDIELGKISIIYIYGLRLQINMKEGDVIILTLTHRKGQKEELQYFFRFHRDGIVWDFDLALIQPIDVFVPNPNETLVGASITLGLTLGLGWRMDPEKKYSWRSKFLYALRFNVFGGALNRRLIDTNQGGNVLKEEIDGFLGVGVTLLDFMVLGIGSNIAKSPHAIFPVVGIEVNHLFKLLKSFKDSTHMEWTKYQAREKKRLRN